MSKGAEFAELGPKVPTTGLLRNGFQTLPITSQGLEDGNIFRISGDSSRGIEAFRLGQQGIFWLGVSNPVSTDIALQDNWITRLRLKPWWARPNLEYRVPGETQGTGAGNFIPLDVQTFGLGEGGLGSDNNRNVWIPSPKRLDITEFNVIVPPPAAVVRTSDSLFVDDVWTLDLRDGSDPAYIAHFPAPQAVARWVTFTYPIMGYALGFTWEATYAVVQQGNNPLPQVSLTYTVGTMG